MTKLFSLFGRIVTGNGETKELNENGAPTDGQTDKQRNKGRSKKYRPQSRKQSAGRGVVQVQPDGGCLPHRGLCALFTELTVLRALFFVHTLARPPPFPEGWVHFSPYLLL